MSDDVVGLTRTTANDLVEHLYGSQPEDAPRNREQRGDDDRFRPRNVFRNDSGETIPPYALLRITGMAPDRYFLTVNKPNGEPVCIVNGPRAVPPGGFGAFQDASQNLLIRTDETEGTVGAGDDWPAVAGEGFKVLGGVAFEGVVLARPSASAPASAPADPEDPANNNDCCEFGRLFICRLPVGIEYEILCSAIDPPIDGTKMYKVRFFAVDTNGNEIVPEDESGSSSEIFEHKELLTLPCTSEVCKAVDLSSVTLNGVELGEVTYGNQEGCCAIFFLETAAVGPVGAVNNLDWIRGQTSWQQNFTDNFTSPGIFIPYNIDLNTEINLPLTLSESDLSTDLPYSVVTTVTGSDVEILRMDGGFSPALQGGPVSPSPIFIDSVNDLQGPVFQTTRTGTFRIEPEFRSIESISNSGSSVVSPVPDDFFNRSVRIFLGGVAIRYIRGI